MLATARGATNSLTLGAFSYQKNSLPSCNNSNRLQGIYKLIFFVRKKWEEKIRVPIWRWCGGVMEFCDLSIL